MYGNYTAINGISAGQLDNFGRRADGTVMLSEYGSSHGIKAAGQDRTAAFSIQDSASFIPGDLRESTGRGSDLGSPGTRQLPPWGHQRRLGSESVLSSPTDSDATPSRYQQVSQEIVCQSDFAQIFHFAPCLITCHIPLIFRPIVSYAFLADGFLFF